MTRLHDHFMGLYLLIFSLSPNKFCTEMLLFPNETLEGDVLSTNKIYQGDVISPNVASSYNILTIITG